MAMSLLEKGADPTLQSAPGATALYAAVHLQWVPKSFYPQPTSIKQEQTTYLELMTALLDAGADPNARLERHLWYTSFNHNVLGVDTWGATPFWRAAYGTDVDAMKPRRTVRRADRPRATAATTARRRKIRRAFPRWPSAARVCSRSTRPRVWGMASDWRATPTGTLLMAGSPR